MLTEKIFTSGYVTLDILNDSLNGQSAVVEWFEHMLIKRAEEMGYVMLRPPKVYFQKIDELSTSPLDIHMLNSQMLKVHAIGRAAKVTKIENCFPQGDIHAC